MSQPCRHCCRFGWIFVARGGGRHAATGKWDGNYPLSSFIRTIDSGGNIPSTSQHHQINHHQNLLTNNRGQRRQFTTDTHHYDHRHHHKFYDGNHKHENSSSNSSKRVYLRLSSVGLSALSYIAYHQYERQRRIKEGIQTLKPPITAAEEKLAEEKKSSKWGKWKCFIYTHLPLRAASRICARVNEIRLHTSVREPLLGLYVRMFSCQMAEAEIGDLREYENLSALFNRRLKSNCRPIDTNAPLVSPADGVIQSMGTIAQDGQIEQVKGISYSLTDFLGPSVIQHMETFKQTKSNENGMDLHYCVVYLAPGDYHGFHSPTDWTLTKRYHFTGELFSVSTWIMERIPGILCLNERVLLTGRWEYGFFSLTAVGSTNVGNILIDKDPDLRTNVPRSKTNTSPGPTQISQRRLAKTGVKRGDRIGQFRLGSSVVLLFSAPRDSFRFTVNRQDRIRYGQPIGQISIVTDQKED